MSHDIRVLKNGWNSYNLPGWRLSVPTYRIIKELSRPSYFYLVN